jgi:predicted O-methyltransferase YrrM
MIGRIKQIINPYVRKHIKAKMPIHWVKKDHNSRLFQIFVDNHIVPTVNPFSARIEKLAYLTNQRGAQPLWEGYKDNNIAGPTRMPDGVRTAPAMGNLYTYLVQALQPKTIVEFGTAFGVSGMYFLAGIESNNKGMLLTFDPNDVWATLAKDNLSQISDRFKLTIGTFEENIENVLPQGETIDLAFIDAIHTKEFVVSQLDIVVSRSSHKAIIILDDINFSDNMRECWQQVSRDSRFTSSVAIGDRVGVLELK